MRENPRYNGADLKHPGRFAKYFSIFFGLLFLLFTHPRFVGVDSPGMFANFQNSWQDFMFKRSGAALKPGDSRLTMVAMDVETGKKYGFPLPRKVFAPMLDKFKEMGVRVVIFDVMFFEPREGDAELAAATARFGKVVHLFAQDLQETSHGVVTATSLPVPALLKVSKYFGHPNIEDLIDNDGHIRRYSLFRQGAPDPFHPTMSAVSLEAATLAADQDKTIEQIHTESGDDIHSLNFRLPKTWAAHEKRDGGKKIANLDIVVSPYRRISLLDVLTGSLTAEQREALKGGIVIVGSTALGYYDHYPTPFVEQAPGAEFHLNAIDNALHNDAMRSPPRALTLLFVVLAVFLAYLFQTVSAGVGAGMAGLCIIAWIAFAAARFRYGFIVEFIPPTFAFAGAYGVLVMHRVMEESRERAKTKNLFGQFVSPAVVEKLISDPNQVKLGGEKREMTVFFLDIAHFTNISEKMDPEALILFLNKYLSRLSHLIHLRRGTIDKYIGDCIMAFWNAPLENPDHRVDAILAALDCQDAVADLNKTLDPSVPETPAVRIGINSGVVTVGLTGSEMKLQYTVIGDEVNLASRLEGANKFFGSRIVISEATYSGARDKVVVRTLGWVRVIGKETAIRIFEPIGRAGALGADWKGALPVYESAIAEFEAKNWVAALASFQKFAQLMPDDGPGQLYLRLSREYSVLPPDDAWKGVFNLRDK